MRRRPAISGLWRACAGLLLLGLLAGCGFHLQGSYSWPAQWRSYQLDFPARDLAMARFVQQLGQTLRQRGLEPAPDGALRMNLLSLTDRKTVAAIGGDGKAVEFDLLRELRFQLVTADWRSEVFTVTSNRRLSFDPTVVLAKEAEEEQLRRALSRDLIEMLVLRAEAELRARPQPAEPQGN